MNTPIINSMKHGLGRKLFRKSQVEVFGLAMIVVLITIGFFLVVSLRNKNPQPDYKQDYTSDELGQNFVNSLINVNVMECGESKFTISDLIKYCKRGENVSQRCGEDACPLVNRTIALILNRTLVVRNDGFMFYTENLGWPNGPNSDIMITNPKKNCTANMNQGQRGVMPIRLYPDPGNVFLDLSICK